MMFFLLFVVVCHSYVRICGEHATDPNVMKKEYNPGASTDQEREEYCYKFYSAPGWYQRGEWYPNGRVFTIERAEEHNDFDYAPFNTGKFFCGVVKGGYFEECANDFFGFLDFNTLYINVDGSNNTEMTNYITNHAYDGGDVDCLANDPEETTPMTYEQFCFTFAPGAGVPHFDLEFCSAVTYDTVCKAKIPYCNGLPSYDSNVCSGHGSCKFFSFQDSLSTGKGKCYCDFLYSDDNCQKTHKCGAYYHYQKGLVCSNNGNCTAENICRCKQGYFGAECELTYLNNTVCKGENEWIWEDGCYKSFPSASMDFYAAESACNSWGDVGNSAHLVYISGYLEEQALRGKYGRFATGLMKNNNNDNFFPCPLEDGYLWFGMKITDSYARKKGNRLRCSTFENRCFIIDDPYYWNEASCSNSSLGIDIVCKKSLPYCAGKSAIDPKVCSERGSCIAPDNCQCSNGYVGDNCQTWKCGGEYWDFKTNERGPCSNHGTCMGPNTCVCMAGYGGTNCEYHFCGGYRSDDTQSVCNGNGECISTDVCQCHWDYGGEFCLSPKPYDQYVSCQSSWTSTCYPDNANGNIGDLGSYAGDNPGNTASGYNDPMFPSLGTSSCVVNWGDLGTTIGPGYPGETKGYPGFSKKYKTVQKVFYYGQPTGLPRLNAFDHDIYASTDWYPGKGTLMSLHSVHHMRFAECFRLEYGQSFQYAEDSVIIGLRKNFTGPSFMNPECVGGDFGDVLVQDKWPCLCSSLKAEEWPDPGTANYKANYRGFYNTDGTQTDKIMNEVNRVNHGSTTYDFLQAYCNSDTDCFAVFGKAPCTSGLKFGDLFHCFAAGKCTAPQQYTNDYQCEAPAWGLYAYTLHYCFNLREDDPSVCQGNGFCWDHDQCTCKGKIGYFDVDCKTKTCHGTKSNETSVCSAHGSCMDDDYCVCSSGWFGLTCNVTICEGKWTNETHSGQGLEEQACNGHGECFDYNRCRCYNSKYFGDNCEKTFCKYIASTNNESVCSGHGDCWPFDTCKCKNPQGEELYSGMNCEIFKCFGKYSDEPDVCNGGGNCIEIDKCKCIDGLYAGETCNLTTCNGIDSDNDTVCSGHGKCESYQTCTCTGDWVGEWCNLFKCYDKRSNENGVCSNHGECIGHDVCNCTLGWYDDQCHITKCFGKNTSESDVCWGRGRCIEQDVCVCNPNQYGPPYCNQSTCNGILYNETNDVCDGKGKCILYNTCDCFSEEDDPLSYCSKKLCFGISPTLSEQVCSGQGDCTALNKCICKNSDGYYGIECKEYMNVKGSEVDYRYDFLSSSRTLLIDYVIEYDVFKLATWYSTPTLIRLNKFYPCSKFFTFYVNGAPNNAVFDGTTTALCVIYGDEDSKTSKIKIKLGDGAAQMKSANSYEIVFKLARPSAHGSTNATVYYSPSKDENVSPTFNPPFLNDNDDEWEEPKPPAPTKPVVVDNDEGDEEGSQSNTGAIVGGSVSGSVVFIFLVFIFCCVCQCLCLCFCCCCCGVCGYQVVKEVFKDRDEKIDPNKIDWKSKFSWKKN